VHGKWKSRLSSFGCTPRAFALYAMLTDFNVMLVDP
jgi:hypothetical protein